MQVGVRSFGRSARAPGGAKGRIEHMDAAAIVVMIIVGAIAGWLASLVVGGPWSLLGYIVAGIIGGVVGGWLLNMAKVNINLGPPIVNQIITAAIGAIVVILIARLIR
jgi:uncharacterized membrane protein YeaQ/YmgE (transglycosylase-associated protein family)